jgi:hypothetical protein
MGSGQDCTMAGLSPKLVPTLKENAHHSAPAIAGLHAIVFHYRFICETALNAQVGDCPNKQAAQIQNRCDPYCPDLPRLFLPRPDAG